VYLPDATLLVNMFIVTQCRSAEEVRNVVVQRKCATAKIADRIFWWNIIIRCTVTYTADTFANKMSKQQKFPL
jgi:hypothetical protein